jgi:hypothetical protein
MKLFVFDFQEKDKVIEDMKSFIRWYVNKYITEVEELEITLNVHSSSFKPNSLADTCCTNQQEVWKSKFELNFHVRKNCALIELIKLMAHEMTHVKQYAMDEMEDVDEVLVKWKGRCYNTNKVEYYDRPWEIDAFGRERGVMLSYVEENNLTKLLRKRFYI